MITRNKGEGDFVMLGALLRVSESKEKGDEGGARVGPR